MSVWRVEWSDRPPLPPEAGGSAVLRPEAEALDRVAEQRVGVACRGEVERRLDRGGVAVAGEAAYRLDAHLLRVVDQSRGQGVADAAGAVQPLLRQREGRPAAHLVDRVARQE